MDINKRLYTFGCSFTKYKWPTWADFIGNQFEIYENWGQPGAGNLFISTQVYECCQKNCVGVNDTVLVMLSSTNRFDIIDRNSNFLTEGNIYNSPSLPKEFVENLWSEEFGIYLTWFAANSIKRLLDGIGCKYRIMTAFDLTKLDDDSLMTEDLAVKGRVIHTLHDLRTEFTPKVVTDLGIYFSASDKLTIALNVNNLLNVSYKSTCSISFKLKL